MARGRAPEDEQVEMFHLIERRLGAIGLAKYEISNFAKPGAESRHNLVYWSDRDFWGLGLSAHSYDASVGPFGERFWNSKDLREYALQCDQPDLPQPQSERLKRHEAMTDYCHMFLRTRRGLSTAALRNKFDAGSSGLILEEIERLCFRRLLQSDGERFHLTQDGELVSNQVFEKLTFLPPLTRTKSNTYWIESN